VSTREFVAARQELSPIQKEVVEWDAGPILVLAGPGSGKTRVLTYRIACILNSSRDKNFRVLALTFTNKAADEMRQRVRDFVPGMEARLFLGTFHSFCADVLRQHGTHLGVNPNFSIYSQDADLMAVLDDAVEGAKKTSAMVSDLDKKTLPVIKRLKSLLIMPENCRESFKNADFGERMSVVYPAYEMELTKRNALDFDSLILKTYQLFSKFPAFAKRYRTVYPYICIDEFQDTNRAQYALIRALTEDQHRNIFAVADDDQIIYQWNGASHKRIVEFRNDYLAEVRQLPVVYRCPPEIVVLANNLIRHNFLRTPDKKPLEAFHSSPGPHRDTVRLLPVFPDFETEVVGIARDIKGRHSARLGSVVVLGRSRKLLQGVERALQGEKLPAVISQRKDEFESTPFVWLHSILRLANDRQNRSYLETVCGAFVQLTGVDIDSDEVVAQAQASNRDYLRQWISLIRKGASSTQAEDVVSLTSHFLGEGRDFREFSRLALDWFSNLTQGHQQSGGDPTIEIFARYEEERFVWEELVRKITESLGAEVTLEMFLQELQSRLPSQTQWFS
jgi:DNA helicase-2/ATP-dependent DNA helicase PcrA